MLIEIALKLFNVFFLSLTIQGRVIDDQTRLPVSLASIEILGTQIGATTDSLGFFQLDNPPKEKKLVLKASHIGYLPDTVTVYLHFSNPAILYFRLKPNPIQLPEVKVLPEKTLIERAEPGVVFKKEDIRKTPANFGDDPLRSMPIIAGVGMSGSEWSGSPVIRGGDTDESPVFYDGIEVAWPWHLVGLISVFNSDFVESVSLWKSSIPIQYDALSSVTLISTPEIKKMGGGFVYDAIALKGYFWTPIANFADIALSLRKTFYYIKIGSLGREFNPNFYDGALNLGFDITKNDRLTAGFLLVEDFFFEASDSSRESTSLYKSEDSFYEVEDSSRERLSLCKVGYLHSGETFDFKIYGSCTYHLLGYEKDLLFPRVSFKHTSLSSNIELVWRPNKRMETIVGEEIKKEATSLASDYLASSTYAEIRAEILPEFLASLGCRLERIPWTTGLYLAPRTSVTWNLFEILNIGASYRDSYQHPYRILRSSFYVKDFSFEPPALDNLNPGFEALAPKRAQQYSAWLEFCPDTSTQIRMEPYYRRLSFLPLLDADSGWNSNGYGFSEGVEFGIEKKTNFGLQAEISYVLSATKRLEGDLVELCWGEYDQRHNINIRLHQSFSKGWLITASFRLNSGLPYTPVNDKGELGKPNSARSSFYHRLDLRVQRSCPELPLSPYFYIEVINVYNSQSPYRIKEYIDSTGTPVIYGYGRIPFLPMAGIGGSF